MIAKELLDEAYALNEKIVSDRRFLHKCPGTGFDIKETLDYVQKELKSMGYKPKKCGKAGIIASAGKKDGKVIMLRADMDALPVKEEADIDFPSQNGRMHACGHDMHTAMLLGAARLLKAHEDEINGTVKLMFQPAEEIFEGSKDMIDAGVLKNPDVDAALMVHVMAGIPLEAGTVVVSSPGVSAPAADFFEITVQGKGCHGSMPNAGVDPLTAASHILIALQEINARELAMNEHAVVTVGTVNAGTAPNVIPDKAVMGGSIRTFDEDTRSFVKKRITEISGCIAAALRADVNVTFGSGCPSLVNDKNMSESAEKYLHELLGEKKVFTTASFGRTGGNNKSAHSAGSEDFAYISREVPSVMLALAAGNPDKGYTYSQHHPKVKFDEDVLPIGSAAYAYTAMRWLEENREAD